MQVTGKVKVLYLPGFQKCLGGKRRHHTNAPFHRNENRYRVRDVRRTKPRTQNRVQMFLVPVLPRVSVEKAQKTVEFCRKH